MRFEVVPVQHLAVINQTQLRKAEHFIRKKTEKYDLFDLEIHLKWHRRGGQLTTGYCNYKKNVIVAAVKHGLEYPQTKKRPVGTVQVPGGYEWIWDEETVSSPDELMVWIAGHELWHFLCKTKQERGNFQTKANRFGFEWLREFKKLDKHERGSSNRSK